MKVYLASSFAYTDRQKTEARKATMNLFEQNLINRGIEVYNPSKLKIKNAWDYSMWDWGQLVFEADHKELDKCDLLCANCHREFHYLHTFNGLSYDDFLKN